MRFESPDHALRRYANLRQQLSEVRAYDPASIRKRCKALVCRTCQKSRVKDQQRCGHKRARWIEWDEWVLKGGPSRGESRRLTVRPRGNRRRRAWAPHENALAEMATLGACFDRLRISQRRVLWLYVVEDFSYRGIAEFGAEHWPDAVVSWNKNSVGDFIRTARDDFATRLGTLLA